LLYLAYTILKSLIYYVAPSGHHEKWYVKLEIKNKIKIANNIFRSIDNVAIVGLAWCPSFEFEIFEVFLSLMGALTHGCH
jgi:hypothetical protein